MLRSLALVWAAIFVLAACGGDTETTPEGEGTPGAREVVVTLTADGLQGAEDLTADAGDSIQFRFVNETDETYELEVVGVGQNSLGEQQVTAGDEGVFVVQLPQAGQYTLRAHPPGDAETGYTARLTVR